MERKRGVSLIVSSLLMIFVAMTSSVLTYYWVTSMIRFQSVRTQTEIRVEQVSWIDSRHFVVKVRDMGAVSATLESVSIRKNALGQTPESFPAGISISPGEVADVRIAMSTTTLEANTSYAIRVTTNTGFYYECTSTTGIIS